MRIARGIYSDRYGFRVTWRERRRQQEKHFPQDTPLDALKAYRLRMLKERDEDAALDPTGSFPRDAVRFLQTRKGLVSYKSDRAHLRPWIHRFKRLSRWAITHELVTLAIAGWQRDGYAPRTLRHRLRVLTALFHMLDGARSKTPCDAVTLPTIQRPRPISVSDTLVRDVALQLRKQEIPGIRRLRDAKTRARFLVLATTGQRPCQVMRATPRAVDLQRRLWFVEPAKGDNGTIVALNADMVLAWQLFIAARAWGAYDSRSFSKTLQRNGWPKGVRPYTLRHTVGLSLSEAGVDLGDIQAHMGHRSINTTRTFYVPALRARLQAASAAIDHRINPDLAALPVKAPMTALREDGKYRKRR